jgi:hypothetical protein
MALQAAGSNGGLCGDSQAAKDQQFRNDAQTANRADMPDRLARLHQMTDSILGGKPAPGNVPGTQPDAASPLDPSAPQKALPPIAPQTPFTNPNHYVNPPTQGNSAAQGAGAQVLVKAMAGGGM